MFSFIAELRALKIHCHILQICLVLRTLFLMRTFGASVVQRTLSIPFPPLTAEETSFQREIRESPGIIRPGTRLKACPVLFTLGFSHAICLFKKKKKKMIDFFAPKPPG